jgi:2-keto-myo-inositol isomerase
MIRAQNAPNGRKTMPRPDLRFALNHIIAPRLGPAEFFALARGLGIDAVEIRNDIDGNAILDGTSPSEIRRLAQDAGVRILTINALQLFDDWRGPRPAEAATLADYAQACGAEGLVLVPSNDGSRPDRLLPALEELRALLATRGLIGFVEPLGFATCSLRTKAEAAAAIEATGGGDVFRLVHDTFHHHLAGEQAVFPRLTGLVHISGVAAPDVAVADMRDSHRILVTAEDRIGNLGQIQALFEGGYIGPFSFEPFATEVQALDDPVPAIRASMDLVRDRLSVAVA